jgi:hypothetical protein
VTDAQDATLLARYRKTFEKGDYTGFLEALLFCCWNSVALPDWVATIAIRQAHDAFDRESTGAGKHGNWRAKAGALNVDQIRAQMAHWHLRARHRHGKSYVSDLAALQGYGTPVAEGGPNVVTRDEIFAFISGQLAGTPFRGSKEAIEESYSRVKRAGGLPSQD